MRKCPYCKGKLKAERSSRVHGGRDYGKILICENWPQCDAYVGTHRKTGEPLGTPANKILRDLRARVHNLFDPMWKRAEPGRARRTARNKAYRFLAKITGIPFEDCHIGSFRDEDCIQAIQRLKNINGARSLSPGDGVGVLLEDESLP